MLLLKPFTQGSWSVDGAPKRDPTQLLSFRARVCHPNTRIYVRLLGPCFKTGRMERSSQAPQRASPCSAGVLREIAQHIPEAVLHHRTKQPTAAAMTTLDSSLLPAVSAKTDANTNVNDAHFSHSPTGIEASLTGQADKCKPTIYNSRRERFDPTPAASAHHQP